MTLPPNRPAVSTRRIPTSQRGYAAPVPVKKSNTILWALLGIALVTIVVLVARRLQYQDNWRQNDEKIMAMLKSADQLIQENREDEAEAVVSQGLGLLPGDERCQQMIERINTKREMVRQRKTETADALLMQAEQLAKKDIALAIEELDKIIADKSLTSEAHKSAVERIAALKRGVCSLRMPKDWPSDAVLTFDDVTKEVVKGVLEGIVPGKYKVLITRYGFRDPLPKDMELVFRGTDPLPLPTIVWKPRGAKIFVKSKPSGAAVWWQGKDTGKITPCEIDDADDGPIEFLLKHPQHEATSLKGQVKDRQPLSLTANLNPLGGSPP